MVKHFLFKYVVIVLCICLLSPLYSYAADNEAGRSQGQLVYVPAYSHIYSGNREQPFLLTVTLSIRNIDPKNQIKIISIDYYETQGKLLKKYIDKPIVLNPLATSRYIVPQKDKSGGSGANFLVEWQSDKNVNPPIIESIMISTQMQRGISFTSRGQEILIPKQ
jgi:Protein of unknown function (DUF3124)